MAGAFRATEKRGKAGRVKTSIVLTFAGLVSLSACHSSGSSVAGGLEGGFTGDAARRLDAAPDAPSAHDSGGRDGAHRDGPGVGLDAGDSATSRGDASRDVAGDGPAPTDAVMDAPVPVPVLLPLDNALSASALAVIVNLDDPTSVAIGAYYAQKRSLPAANVISVHVPIGASITSVQFATVKAAVDAVVTPEIQAYALAFTQPYLVQCMSITSAFAFGFDTKWCNTSGQTCGATAENPYFQKDDHAPFTHLGMRPTMMLAGAAQADIQALIDRGVASDDTYPKGTDYMLITNDVARSVRGFEFQDLASVWDPATGVTATVIDNADGGASNFITGKTDVLFYFTGLASVPQIATNTYLPGAMADHLTSYGGIVPTSGQMSAVAWLKAGASASYGTVVEPCNYTAKFPDPSIAVPRYYRGGTAVEAYWKSVEWPGEGLFIGEPLASPWRSPIVTFHGGTLTIQTTSLDPAQTYRLEGAAHVTGPFTTVQSGIRTAKVDLTTITVVHATDAYYRLVLDVGDAGPG